MLLAEELDDLWRELSAIVDACAGAAPRLSAAARRLQAPGALPDDDLLDLLHALKDRFGAVRSRARRLADALGLGPSDRSLDHLRAVAKLLERLDEAAAGRPAGAEVFPAPGPEITVSINIAPPTAVTVVYEPTNVPPAVAPDGEPVAPADDPSSPRLLRAFGWFGRKARPGAPDHLDDVA